jgi:chemotaxis protein CheX
MPTALEFTEQQIRENIARAVGDVFKTMLNRPAQPVPADAAGGVPAARPGSRQVVGTVGFAGEANGAVYIYFNEAFAKKCTGGMLGLSDQEIEEMGSEPVNDAVGELSNMIVGSFKNGLNDAGFPCKLSIPSTLSGTDFTISPWPHGSARRHAYAFESLGQFIVADVILKLGN